MVSETVLRSSVLYGFFIAFSRLTPQIPPPQNHAFITSLSICYLADVATIAHSGQGFRVLCSQNPQ